MIYTDPTDELIKVYESTEDLVYGNDIADNLAHRADAGDAEALAWVSTFMEA